MRNGTASCAGRDLALATVALWLALAGHAVTGELSAPAITFAKDVMPLLQAKCQVCHRPGSIAPMSLLTFDEVRPWARAIRQRVVLRQMPPWHIDRKAGIQRYKNDRSLSEAEIDTLVRWVDDGVPFGDPDDLPPPAQWPDEEGWTIGTPDLIVTSPNHIVGARGPDWLGDYIVETGLTEDRYVMAIETKPSIAGRQVLHHALTFVVPDTAGGATDGYLSEYAVGKYGDVFPAGAGRLLKAGSRLRFNMHYHPVGKDIADRTSVGFVFYPKGYVPDHEVVDLNVGLRLLDDDLDIPANRVTRHRATERLTRPARLISFQPHMHMRGRAMTLEAIYPTGSVETIGAVDRFDFNWHVAYVYADDVAPLLPAGTVLRATATYDNTAGNPRNPDPDQWIGFGNRTIDEMLQCHVLLTYLDETEYRQMLGARTRR
jgi:hypothetical protein